MPFANKTIRTALIAIFTCSLLMAFVSDVLAQSDENTYQSLQIQRELLEVEQQRLQLEQQRYRQEQQQELERLKGQIANLISKIQDKRSTLLRMRQENLEKLETMSLSLEQAIKHKQATIERLEKDIIAQRNKLKSTHPRTDAATHFTGAFQQPLEQRRKDISYIFDRYERAIGEMNRSLAKFPAVVPDDFAEPQSTVYEKTCLSTILAIGQMHRFNITLEYKVILLTQERLDNDVRWYRKFSPKELPAEEQSLTEQTRELVQDFSAAADSDAKVYASWMSLAEQ